MVDVEKFEKLIGGRWIGVVFENELKRGKVLDEEDIVIPRKPIRFCEAVKESYTGPIALDDQSVSCEGALYAFGWMSDREALVEKISKESNLSKETARKLLASIPRLNGGASRIIVGTYREPDLILSFAQPEAVMRLVYLWEKMHGNGLKLENVGSVMSVCANVAVKTYCTNQISISFGCPVSRKSGDITRDRLVVGVPCGLLDRIISNV